VVRTPTHGAPPAPGANRPGSRGGCSRRAPPPARRASGRPRRWRPCSSRGSSSMGGVGIRCARPSVRKYTSSPLHGCRKGKSVVLHLREELAEGARVHDGAGEVVLAERGRLVEHGDLDLAEARRPPPRPSAPAGRARSPRRAPPAPPRRRRRPSRSPRRPAASRTMSRSCGSSGLVTGGDDAVLRCGHAGSKKGCPLSVVRCPSTGAP
jgi:hypothetical protein